MNIPDAPWIRETEATGYSSYGYWNHPPKDDGEPVCPVCGETTDEFYKNNDGEVIGCPNCISTVDAWEEVSDGDVYYGNETDSF